MQCNGDVRSGGGLAQIEAGRLALCVLQLTSLWMQVAPGEGTE